MLADWAYTEPPARVRSARGAQENRQDIYRGLPKDTVPALMEIGEELDERVPK